MSCSPGSSSYPSSRLAALAEWSPWVTFVQAVQTAPKEPGVYLARQGDEVLYVGMAGPRDRGGKTAPKGLRGRLAFHGSGKALASGLGEAVFARAIADADWLRARLADVEAGHAGTLRDWGRAAFQRADLGVCWAVTADRDAATELEQRVLDLLRDRGLWNQR